MKESNSFNEDVISELYEYYVEVEKNKLGDWDINYGVNKFEKSFRLTLGGNYLYTSEHGSLSLPSRIFVCSRDSSKYASICLQNKLNKQQAKLIHCQLSSAIKTHLFDDIIERSNELKVLSAGLDREEFNEMKS